MTHSISNAERSQTPGEISPKAVQFRLLIPHGSLPLIEEAIGEDLKHRLEDAVAIVHYVYRSGASYRNLQTFWPINFQLLAKIVRRADCATLLQRLRKAQIIVCDEIFVPDVKSHGYRLSQKMIAILRENPKPFVVKVKDRRLHRAFLKSKEGKFYVTSPLDRRLYSFLKDIEIDQADAHMEIAAMDGERAVCAMRLVQDIAYKDFWYKKDFAGRRYSNVSCIHKSLRKKLTWKGETLGESDVANSQLLTLGIVLHSLVHHAGSTARLTKLLTKFARREDAVHQNGIPEHAMTEAAKRRKERKEEKKRKEGGESLHMSNEVTQIVYFDELETQKCVLKCKKIAMREVPEIQEFIRWCETGDFYQAIFAKSHGRGFETEIEKDEFKEMFFKYVLYGNPMDEAQVTNIFRSEFPAIYEIIVLMKRPRYEAFALLMQHVESEFVIERAAKLFLDRNPGRPIMTIHDSFLTLAEDCEKAIACLKEAFAGSGVTPKVRRK